MCVTGWFVASERGRPLRAAGGDEGACRFLYANGFSQLHVAQGRLCAGAGGS